MSFLQDLLGDAYKEGLTEEEISKALEAKKVGVVPNDYEKLKSDYQKSRESISKANSEAAKYKKQYEAYLDDEQKKKLEAEEFLKKLREENEALKKEKEIADYTAQYIGMGFSPELAKSTAEAMASGDTETVFKSMASFKADFEKQIRANIMREAPDPVGGPSKSTTTLEDLRKMSIKDRFAFSQEHPEEYASLYKNQEE